MKFGGNKIFCIVTSLTNGIIEQFIIVFWIRVERFRHKWFFRESSIISHIDTWYFSSQICFWLHSGFVGSFATFRQCKSGNIGNGPSNYYHRILWYRRYYQWQKNGLVVKDPFNGFLRQTSVYFHMPFGFPSLKIF